VHAHGSCLNLSRSEGIRRRSRSCVHVSIARTVTYASAAVLARLRRVVTLLTMDAVSAMLSWSQFEAALQSCSRGRYICAAGAPAARVLAIIRACSAAAHFGARISARPYLDCACMAKISPSAIATYLGGVHVGWKLASSAALVSMGRPSRHTSSYQDHGYRCI